MDIGEQFSFKYVEIVVEFFRIGEIDTMNEKYRAELNIESKWVENDINIEQYDPKIHWNPQLFIENALQETKQTIEYEIDRQNDGTVWIIEKRNVKGVFWEKLELENFPFDIQELNVILTSKLNSKEIKLVTDPTKISYINPFASFTFIDQQKWRLYKFVEITEHCKIMTASTNTLKNILNEYSNYSLTSCSSDRPYFQAKIYCSRLSGFYIFNAFLLIFLITCSALTIFAIDCKLPQGRLQTTCTLLLTSVSLKWVTNRYLPTISYLTSLDKYSMVCIFFLCLLSVWHAVVGTNWSKSFADRLDSWMLISFSVVFFLLNLFAFIWFLFAYKKILNLASRESKYMKKILRRF